MVNNTKGSPILSTVMVNAVNCLFSCHAIDNPSEESELALLCSYGAEFSDIYYTHMVPGDYLLCQKISYV